MPPPDPPSMDDDAVLTRPRSSTLEQLELERQDNSAAQRGELQKLISRTSSEDEAFEWEEFREDGLTEQEAKERLDKYGPNTLPSTETPAWKQILNLLTQPMALMMWVAALIEALIANYPDMGILLGIIVVNASISFYETQKSGNAVKELQNTMKPKATVRRNGKLIQDMNAEELVPGDTVKLHAGCAVPADCRVAAGVITVDQAALTGESLPVTIDEHTRDELLALMGTTVMTGEVEATVQHTGIRTTLGRTAALLDRPPEKSNLDKVLFKIVMVMASLSVVLSLVVFAFGILKGEEPTEVLSFTVVLIVASIPMAVEIVTTTTLALGARVLAKDGGAIVTRLSSVEDMASMNMLCSDKTGTLTLNKMELTTDEKIEEKAIFQPGVTRKQLVQWAAMATKWNDPPGDALDRLVLEAADLNELNRDNGSSPPVRHYQQSEFIPFNPTDKFTRATIERNGSRFKVQKGAPDIIINMCEATPGADLERAHEVQEEMATRGIRCLAIAVSRGDSEDWKLQGMLTFLDPPRKDSKETIKNASELGVPVRMITGDHLSIARETCNQLGLKGETTLGPQHLPQLDEERNAPRASEAAPKNPAGAETIGELIENADAFAQVFPDHKYIIVDVLRQLGYKCGMTGDGVNDAPALKRADVGVCVQGGTDAARAAADIVLTREGLSTIVDAIKLAREIFARINNFMSYRLAASMQLLFYFFIAVLTIHPSEYADNSDSSDKWPYMYSMPVLLLMLITLLNDGALITIGYDNVTGSRKPTSWNIRMLFAVSFVLAAVACASSLLLLHLALGSGRSDSFFQKVGLPEMSLGHITTMMYLKVSVSDFLTLFSCRAGEQYWWESTPAPIVTAAAFVALSSSTIVACFWPASVPILDSQPVVGLMHGQAAGWSIALYVWMYCIVWWWVQDFCKVKVYKVCRARRWFGAQPEDAPTRTGDDTEYELLAGVV